MLLRLHDEEGQSVYIPTANITAIRSTAFGQSGSRIQTAGTDIEVYVEESPDQVAQLFLRSNSNAAVMWDVDDLSP